MRSIRLESFIGLNAVAGEITCVAALTALSLGGNGAPSFGALWDGRLNDIDRDFARLYCASSAAFERVAEALSYQVAVNSMEVSYSVDDHFFGTASDE
ncbi:MAG: hypothetical protein ACYDHD_01475 [Vulcanimicrobiaceae bacterium]